MKLNSRLHLYAGIHTQYFSLNDHFSIEPRASVKWNINARHTLAAGYGRHSQLEMLQIYFITSGTNNGALYPNKNLDFSKAHHFVIAYDLNISEYVRLKIEPYYQKLYNIPVKPMGTFSMVNLKQDWFINDILINTGTGTNIGVDVTLEKFLKNGFYYLFTASVFDSDYTGGDGATRNTLYNKGYLMNVLVGKEWKVGRNKNNMLSVNGRINLMGGDWMSPVDEMASHEAKTVIYDDSRAFEEQMPAMQLVHFTLNYQRNKSRHASIWSFQLLNAFGKPEFYGYKYNLMTNEIEPDQDELIMPNISYKIQF